MEMDEKKRIFDIGSLSDIILETLKEVTKSGNVLNVMTFSQFLAKKPRIRELLKFANKAQFESSKSFQEVEIEELHVQIAAEEERKKRLVKDLIGLEQEFDREKDFYKRITFLLIDVCRLSVNDLFHELLDNFRQLLIDDADLTKREEILHLFKNQILKQDIYSKSESIPRITETEDISKTRQTLFQKFFGGSSEIKLKSIKKTVLTALDELQALLGGMFENKIATLKERITECEDINYLLSLRKQIIGIIQEYIQNVTLEKEQVTYFVKEIGKKLVEMEQGIIGAFSISNQPLEGDYDFNEKLGMQIKNIGKSIEHIKDFEKLRSLITSELKVIGRTLDEKRKEYVERIEKAQEEKEKIQVHFEKMINNVMEENKILIDQGQKDPLTGIFNRGTFDEIFTVEFRRYQRYMEPFSIIMFDIDKFKNVNDTYGHEAGDRVLKGVVKCIAGTLRKPDVFARYGGEEFLVLLPKTDIDKAAIVAEKLRKTVQDTEFIYEEVKVPMTISIGTTEIRPDDHDFSDIYTRVDDYTYKAKTGGRNTIVSDLNEHEFINDD